MTPSNSQNAFLEQTITSVLNQNYPSLEYLVIDGGSTDGSDRTVARYQDRRARCVSQPDSNPFEEINKGFAWSTGEIMAWINCSYVYFLNAFSVIAEIIERFPQIE